MSKFTSVMIDLEAEVVRGELSRYEIAVKYNVPQSWVEEAASNYLFDAVDESCYDVQD